MKSNEYLYVEGRGDVTPFGMPKWGDANKDIAMYFPDVKFPQGILLCEEMYCLLRHAVSRNLVVDIGTFKGLSASIMSMRAKTVITYDVYEKFNGMSYDEVQEGGLKNFKNVIAINMDANEAAKSFDQRIDLLFIDGRHEYEHVKSNFESWFPHVKVGGEILFHDYQAYHHEGVVRFVQEEVLPRREVKVIDLVGTIIAFRKLDRSLR